METHYTYHKTYLDFYNKNIAPKLKSIDLFIKSEQEFTKEIITSLLYISEAELDYILQEKNFFCTDKFNLDTLNLDKHSFFEIMLSGTSYICGFYKREIECGSPIMYTPSQLAYIYQLDQLDIEDIFEDMGVFQIHGSDIASVLSKISIK